MIKISVIIATYNRKKYLEKLLTQLRNQELKTINISIIVVVDGSTDGTIQMLENNFPEVLVIKGTGDWWWTRCMNEGFRKAIELKSDFVLILNDDTEIRTDYFLTLWNDYKTIPFSSILGSASITIDPPNLIDSGGTKKIIPWRMKSVPYLPALLPIFPEFKGIYPTWTLNGRGTLIPLSIFEKIGFYDENLIQYGSDDEFILRAKKAGIKVFISWNARVYNHLMLTSEGTAFIKDNFSKFLKSFFNPYSVNSIKKKCYYYKKLGIKLLLPFYLPYTLLGTFNAYLFKYKKFKNSQNKNK